MTKFIEFLSYAHLNNINAALYENGDVRIENVVTSDVIGSRSFESAEAAQIWLESLPGKSIQRLAAAIESIRSAA